MTAKNETYSDEILATIGYAAGLLLKNGATLSTSDITALLRQHADRATEPHKANYIKAIRLITAKMH